MKYNPTARTFDCVPTLTDSQVLAFCRDGHLLLPGIVPQETNRRACDWLDGKLPANPSYLPEGLTGDDLQRMRGTREPSGIMLEEWFLEHVLLNPRLAGVMRSLLGAHVGLPVLVSHHFMECPAAAQHWHHDADCVFGPELRFVEVFYFPQDTPPTLGPTELLPGSHLARTQPDADTNGVLTAGPAGTIGVHHQSIMHRRAASTASGPRRMLKYIYWRTTAPRRDWLADEGFDPRTADYGGHRVARYVAHQFAWLCGTGHQFRVIGGQGWPWRTENQIGPSYGYGSPDGYLPDWRSNDDGYALPPSIGAHRAPRWEAPLASTPVGRDVGSVPAAPPAAGPGVPATPSRRRAAGADSSPPSSSADAG